MVNDGDGCKKEKQMSNHTMPYLELKALQKRAEEEKQKDSITAKNKMFLDSTKTRHNNIPNMKDAYRQVVDSGYVPTEAERHYRRFTSGSYVDGAKK